MENMKAVRGTALAVLCSDAALAAGQVPPATFASLNKCLWSSPPSRAQLSNCRDVQPQDSTLPPNCPKPNKASTRFSRFVPAAQVAV